MSGTTEQVEALVRQARLVAANIKDESEKLEDLKRKIEELVPVDWNATIDGVPASRRKGNRKFSETLALAQFTVEEKLACITTGRDPAKIKAIAKAKGIEADCMEDVPNAKTVLKLMP